MGPGGSTPTRRVLLLACGLFVLATVGCQYEPTQSSAFLSCPDDVQYFPVGPEDKLYNERRALAEYKAQQQAIAEGQTQEESPAQTAGRTPEGQLSIH